VSEQDNVTALIGRRYPATLNLGVAGDGPLLMLATLKEYVSSLKPQIVLWFYFEGNDLTDLQEERKSALLTRYLNPGFTQSSVLARQSDIDNAILDQIPRLRERDETNRKRREEGRIAGALGSFMKLQVLRERLNLVGGVAAGADESTADLHGAGMSVFRSILLQAKQQTETWGGQLVFVYLPDWGRYAGYVTPEIMIRSDVLTMVRSLGIRIVDVEPAFRTHGDPLSLFPFRRSGHYTESGYQIVATEVLRELGQGRTAASE
jgi:hypothetical protein